jgi:hypothetical protein
MDSLRSFEALAWIIEATALMHEEISWMPQAFALIPEALP